MGVGDDEECPSFRQGGRAKQQESENPFVLDLESRILEGLGQLAPAYESALLASARDPMNAHMQNRLGIIRMKQGSPGLAISHFQKAIELDQDLFSPANSLASAHLDVGDVASAERNLQGLKAKARTPSDSSLLKHTEARIAFSKKEFERSRDLLKQEVTLFHNVVPNLGLLIRVECSLFDRDLREFPTIAALSLKSADAALARIVALDQSNEFIETLRSQIEERQNSIKRGTRPSKTPGAPHPKVPATPQAKTPDSPPSIVPAEPQKTVPLRPPLMPPTKPPSKR